MASWKPAPLSGFLFFKAFSGFHLACREVQPAGWLSTQRRVWCGCDWQGHGVLSGRFWFRNQVVLGNFNGIASSDLKLSFKHRDAHPFLSPFLLLFICNSCGETERSVLFPGLCYFFLSPCLWSLKYLSNARRLVCPGRVRIVYNGRDHSCCCLSTCSCLDRGSTER